MTREPEHRVLAEELKQVIRRHRLPHVDTQRALELVVADLIGEMAMSGAALEGHVPFRDAVKRRIVVQTRGFASTVLYGAQRALPHVDPDEPGLTLDDYREERDEPDDASTEGQG